MFRLYQRYLMANFIPPFLMSLFFFVCFLLTTQLFRLMRIVTKKGVDITVLLELFGHIGVSFLPMAVPLSLVFAMIFTLNKLSEDSEIVAIRSMGVSKYKLFAPFFVVGLLCAITIFGLNRNLIPYSKRHFKNTVIQLTSKGFLADIKKEQFYTEIPNITLFAENVKEGGKVLERVFIKLQLKGGKEKVIMASKGILIKSDKNTGLPSLKLDLLNGNIISLGNDGKEVEKILFKKYEFPILSSGVSGSITRDNMRSNTELLEVIRKYRGELKKPEVQKNDYLFKDYKYMLRKARMEYWSRYNIPILSLAFVLLGFVFGVKKGRGKSKNTSALALVIIILYYVLFFAGVSMVKKGKVDPVLAVFLPTIIISLIGSHYFKKLD